MSQVYISIFPWEDDDPSQISIGVSTLEDVREGKKAHVIHGTKDSSAKQ
jgi:hypothetical protein